MNGSLVDLIIKIDAIDTPLGFMPKPQDINLDGLSINEERIAELSKIDNSKWKIEINEFKDYLDRFKERTPKELVDECNKVLKRL